MASDVPTPDAARLKQVLNIYGARGEAFFGMFLDGLNFELAKAETGDVSARRALRQLRDGLRKMDQQLLISLPGDN